jgi:hypothetical protein
VFALVLYVKIKSMKTNKGFAPIAIVLIIIAVLAVGGVAYSSKKNSKNRDNNTYKQDSKSVVCNSDSTPSIKLLSPNGGEVYTIGQQITVKWETCNATNTKIFIEIYNPKTTALPLVDAINGIQNDGLETITLSEPNIINGQYELRITAGGLSSGVLLDSADNLFTINSSVKEKDKKLYDTSPSVKIIYPNGGEVLKIGQTYNIRLQTKNVPKGSKIWLSFSSPSQLEGSKYDLISNLDANTSNYSWTIYEPNCVLDACGYELNPYKDYKLHAILHAIDPTKKSLEASDVIASDDSDGFFSLINGVEVSLNISAGLQKAFSIWKDGEISECTEGGATYYTGGINAYDGGGATLDIKGNVVGSCQGFTGHCEGIMSEQCERIYAVYPNIWGFPAVNKYNLK